MREDRKEIPMAQKGAEILSNLLLMATVWSFGTVLDENQKLIFEDQFYNYLKNLNKTMSGTASKTGKSLVFDIYYDFERLEWDLINEKYNTACLSYSE